MVFKNVAQLDPTYSQKYAIKMKYTINRVEIFTFLLYFFCSLYCEYTTKNSLTVTSNSIFYDVNDADFLREIYYIKGFYANQYFLYVYKAKILDKKI